MSSPQIPAPTDAPTPSSAAAPPPPGPGRAVGIIGSIILAVTVVPLGFALYCLIGTVTYDGDDEFAALGYVVAAVLGAPTIAAATLAGAAVALRRTAAGVALVVVAAVLGAISLTILASMLSSFL